MSRVDTQDPDGQIGANVTALRGEMSQKALADAMRGRGHRWSQATVWSVEKGERPLRLAEARDVADIFQTPLVSLLVPSEEREKIDQLFQELVYTQSVRSTLGHAVEDFISAKGRLKTRLNVAKAFGLERLEDVLPGFHKTVAEAERLVNQSYSSAVEEHLEERFGDPRHLLTGLGEPAPPEDSIGEVMHTEQGEEGPTVVVPEGWSEEKEQGGREVKRRSAKSGRFSKGDVGKRVRSGKHPEA